jgi:hypothetical protein
MSNVFNLTPSRKVAKNAFFKSFAGLATWREAYKEFT